MPGDLLEQRLRIVVPGPEALEVEDTDAAKFADLDRRGGGGDAVHRAGRCEHGQPELEGVDLPGEETSSGSRVRRDGTIAMSSNP